MKLAGETFDRGAVKYNESLFEANWKKGDKQFYAEAFDHLIDHLYAWWTIKTDPALAEVLGIDMKEDHLGHATANIGFLAYGEAMGFFNEARDPGAPGYQYPFVPEDIPEEFAGPAGTEQPTITEMVEKGVDESEAVEAAEEEQDAPTNWFQKLVAQTRNE
jgi:hypothetical protein